ncbi:MAG: glutamate-1-semialdehyde 2,1-aminomutase [Rhodospirillaceae bacterium]|nr:glutamate-1-semialdehyde 2,1-aminomutase [Rhodospirillaceae bacterium]
MTTTNAALFERATRVIPGGVDSPVRAFRAVGGTPKFFASAQGAYVTDADGKKYLDFVGSWGPLILGHSHPVAVKAVQDAAALGMTYGAPCKGEVELAERVVAAYPGLEQVRFVSSGTEATMSAIRLARGATGRDLIVKFSGCYHGHADHLLVAAGSGLVTHGQPSSAGVPADFAALTRVLPLDDEAKLKALFAAEGNKVAAVIIEPIPANNGLLLQRPEFLKLLRKLTQESGTLLIFDEVISGFRVGFGGAAALYGITPDIATFGKVIGGGLPVGAYGGSRAVMKHIAPEGPVYQAGTLSGNPVAMAAGLATLKVLEQDKAFVRLEELGAQLESELAPVLKAAKSPCGFVRVGSIGWIALQAGTVRSAEVLDNGAGERYKPVFHGLLDRGIYVAPSAYEVMFLSLVHTPAEITRFTQALGEVLAG